MSSVITENGVGNEVLAFQFALAPNKTQLHKLEQYEGAVRATFNKVLEIIKNELQMRRENPQHEGVSLSRFSLRKYFNSIKAEVFPWHKEVSKYAFDTGVDNAYYALTNFFNSRNGKHQGPKKGFPRFQSKGRSVCGIAFSTTPRERRVDKKSKHHFYLPNLGRIRLHQKNSLLKWLTSNGGVIKTCVVKRRGKRWFMTVKVTVPVSLAKQYHMSRIKRTRARKEAVGVDVGIANAFVLSDGLVVANPRHHEKMLDSLRREQQKLTRKKRGSNRYKQQMERVNSLHIRVADKRRDALHKASKDLAGHYSLVAIEDLDVATMAKKGQRRFNRSLGDAAMGEFLEQLRYKADFYGVELVAIPRYYPSSKTCSKCKQVRSKLSLREREFVCFECGFRLDRDLNAARNILDYALGLRAGHEEEDPFLSDDAVKVMRGNRRVKSN